MIGRIAEADPTKPSAAASPSRVSAKPARRWLDLLEDFASAGPVAAVAHQPRLEKRRHRAQQRVVTNLLQPDGPARRCCALESSCRSSATQASASGSDAGKTARRDADLLGKPLGRLKEFLPG